jgi:hypothetical protein
VDDRHGDLAATGVCRHEATGTRVVALTSADEVDEFQGEALEPSAVETTPAIGAGSASIRSVPFAASASADETLPASPPRHLCVRHRGGRSGV